MAKRVDSSAIDQDFVINQAKPSNRQKEHSAYDPSASASTPAPEITEEAREATPPPVVQPETVKGKEITRDENKKRRNKTQTEQEDYEALFIRTASTTTRSGKAVYIRKAFHDRIMLIAQTIGNNELSLFSYIDNVLEHHFNTYQDDITELYRNRRPDDIF